MPEEKSILQKIGDTITDIAPGLAAACALIPGVGTVPAVALGAVSMLGKALGLGTSAKPEDVLAAASNITDPAVRQQIINAEHSFQLAMRDADLKEMGVRLQTYEAQLGDTKSARDMKVDETKVTGKRDWEDKVFDWCIIVGFAATLIAILYYKPPESTYTGMMIGALIAAFTTVVNFRKGSTASGNMKTDMIYNSTPGLPKKDVS